MLYPEFLSPDLLPTLNFKVQFFFRIVSGLLFFSFFIINFPLLKLYFRNKKHGGYHDMVGLQKHLTPVVSNLLLVIWIASTLGIIFNFYLLSSLFFNLIFSYYFFIRLRWRSLARGLGAPGFMYFWLAACLFFLEIATQLAFDARGWVLLMFQVDFAIIMLSAGIYKFTSGYLVNEGMELGMVNPKWGYWAHFYKKLKPKSFVFYFLNQSAWFFEILGAILMFIPTTRLIGGLIIAGSFLFVGTQIRLGNLVYIVITCTFIFIHEGSIISNWITGLEEIPSSLVMGNNSTLALLLISVCLAYMALRPIVLLGLYYNFYSHKKLPVFLQTKLERYTNAFGIILWRVFTTDVVNFFVDVSVLKNGEKTKISHYCRVTDGRFNQVCESITIATIFNALKYFPHNLDIFKERILSYVKTLPDNETVVFEYYRIVKQESGFDYLKVAEYLVENNELKESVLIAEFDPRNSMSKAAAHACASPGSYSPATK